MVKKEIKKDLNLTILELLKDNLKPIQISIKLNISMPLLSYYLKKLKQYGNIKKVGYGTWEVKNYTLKIPKLNKKIRGHAFIWTIKLNKPINWIKYLKDYKLVRNIIPRIILKNQKIWLGKKTITVYDNRSFYGNNSYESRKYAVQGLIEVLEALEKLINLNLKPFKFKVCKEHYSMIKNELAKQYNRSNEKMIIRDDIEGEWIWIDNSESLHEMETKNITRSKQVQDWWNDNKKHNFKVTPTFLMESLNKLTVIQIENQKQLTQSQSQVLQFSKEIKSHLALIQEYRKENINYRKELKKKRTYLNEFQMQLSNY